MKCWNAIRKHLASIVVVVTLIGVFGCGSLLMYEDFYGSDATVELILQLFHVPISPNARLRFQSLHHAPATRHPFGAVNNSVAQEAAPFFGNLSVVTVDPAAPADMFFGLQRQSDCSLTRIDFTASVNNAQTAVTVTPGRGLMPSRVIQPLSLPPLGNMKLILAVSSPKVTLLPNIVWVA